MSPPPPPPNTHIHHVLHASFTRPPPVCNASSGATWLGRCSIVSSLIACYRGCGCFRTSRISHKIATSS
ncbi:hypothetical protein Hanom_Chr05g00421981 [Helianthus anomalus]